MIQGLRWVQVSENDRDEDDTVRGIVPGWGRHENLLQVTVS